MESRLTISRGKTLVWVASREKALPTASTPILGIEKDGDETSFERPAASVAGNHSPRAASSAQRPGQRFAQCPSLISRTACNCAYWHRRARVYDHDVIRLALSKPDVTLLRQRSAPDRLRFVLCACRKQDSTSRRLKEPRTLEIFLPRRSVVRRPVRNSHCPRINVPLSPLQTHDPGHVTPTQS